MGILRKHTVPQNFERFTQISPETVRFHQIFTSKNKMTFCAVFPHCSVMDNGLQRLRKPDSLLEGAGVTVLTWEIQLWATFLTILVKAPTLKFFWSSSVTNSYIIHDSWQVKLAWIFLVKTWYFFYYAPIFSQSLLKILHDPILKALGINWSIGIMI